MPTELRVNQRIQLQWNDISYTVKGPKTLIENVNGHASPGELLAVMGSSGAGKTTLLNALSGKELVGELRGKLHANGAEITSRESFRKIAAFVTQEDVMMESQSVREIIMFSAALRLPRFVASAERAKLVDSLIQLLHLERAADTRVGDPARGGISGGERKRTNVAAELVTNPSVVFLDEPTSGLDAYTSAKVMAMLKDLALGGRTVIATIHQPASEVFSSFDKLALMHTGGLAYFGPSVEALTYFASNGHLCPSNYNPADFLIGVLMQQLYPEEDPGKIGSVEAGHSATHVTQDLLGAWATSSAAAANLKLPNVAGVEKPISVANEGGAGPLVQFGRVAMRNLRQYAREKLGVRARVAQTVLFGLLVGGIFFDLTLDEAGIQDRSGLLFFACLSQMLFGLLQVVLMFPVERRVFEREYAAGYYSVPAYFLAKIVSETPFQIVFPTIFSVILCYMTGLQEAGLGNMIGILILVTNCAAALGFVIGCIAPTPQIAITLVPVFFIPFVLSGGLLANKDRIDPYFTWLETISFFSFGYEACMLNEFTGLEFTFNTTLILVVPTIEMVSTEMTLPNGGKQVMVVPKIGEPTTENRSQEVTRTGEDILDAQGFDGSIQRDFEVLGIWYAVAFTFALTTLWLRVNGGRYARAAKRAQSATA